MRQFNQETPVEVIGATRSRVSFFMNKFRKLGFVEYDGKLKVHNSLLNCFNQCCVDNASFATPIADIPVIKATNSECPGRIPKATAGEIAGQKLFFGKAQCSTCHPAPSYLDNQMHDLHVERFLKNEAGDAHGFS